MSIDSGLLSRNGSALKSGRSEGPDTIFQINDINLVIPPTAISVRKEDLTYQWKTLRTNNSTKIPSGQGYIQVSVRLVFPPSLFLQMHRLVCQFRHSPFCYVENALIRQAIVPDWPITQNMAFTITSMNIQSMSGSPGTFILDLDARWFNYFPYALNWMYKDEYATVPVGPDAIRKSIKTYTKDLVLQDTIVSWNDAASNEEGFQADSYDVISQTKDIVGGFTIDDLIYNHAGTAFDLLPRPSDVMRKATPALPQYSNIYIRYCNMLQQKSLYENFGLDLADLIDPGTMVMFTAGHLVASPPGGTDGFETDRIADAFLVVEGLHTGALPPITRNQIIEHCLSFTKAIDFKWHQYLQVDLGPKMVDLVEKEKAKAVEPFVAEQLEKIQRLTDIVAKIKNSEEQNDYALQGNNLGEVKAIYTRDESERFRYNSEESKKNILKLPTKQESDYIDKNNSEPPYFLSPPVKSYSQLSGFGIRTLNGETRLHKGIDIKPGGDDGVYACFDGTITVIADNPYNNKTNENEFLKAKNLPQPTVSAGYLRNKHQFSTNAGGIAIRLDWDNWSYAVQYMHLSDIGENGVLNEVVMLEVGLDQNDRDTYGMVRGTGNKVKVTRGQRIGTYGNTGRSGGSHVHFEVRKDKEAVDPIPFLLARDAEGWENSDEEVGIPYVLAENLEHDSTSEYKNHVTKSGAVTSEDIESIMDFEESLYNQGFVPYEDSKDVLNVRKRTVQIRYQSSNSNLLPGTLPTNTELKSGKYYRDSNTGRDLPGIFRLDSRDNMVITNVSGALTHIVASIPLVGHEFPTHQHLGSIEPSISIEMVTTSDSRNNDNLSEEGALLEYMRSTLQSNARNFRMVPDSYALATDHFITRLLGSFKETDFEIKEGTNVDFMRKRTMISRVETSTLEGNPGASLIRMELVETNPYDDEHLVLENSPQTESIEDLRKEVIKRIDRLSFTDPGKVQTYVDTYGELYTNEVDIQEVLESLGITPEAFGKESYEDLKQVAVFNLDNTRISHRNPDTNTFYYDTHVEMDEESTDFSKAIGVGGVVDDEVFQAATYDILKGILEAGGPILYGDYHEPINVGTIKLTSGNNVASKNGYNNAFAINMTDFYSVYPELKPASDGTSTYDTSYIKNSWMTLQEIKKSIEFSLVEPEMGIGIPEVREALYDLPVEGKMWNAYVKFLESYLLNQVAKIAQEGSWIELKRAGTIDASINNLSDETIHVIFEGIDWGLSNEVSFSDKETATMERVSLSDSNSEVSSLVGDSFSLSNKDWNQSTMMEEFRQSVTDLTNIYVNEAVMIQGNTELLAFMQDRLPSILQFTYDFDKKKSYAGEMSIYLDLQKDINEINQWFFSPTVLFKEGNAFTVFATNLSRIVRLKMFIGTAMTILSFLAFIVGIFTPVPGDEAAAAGGVAAGTAVAQGAGRLALREALKRAVLAGNTVSTPAAAAGAAARTYHNQFSDEPEIPISGFLEQIAMGGKANPKISDRVSLPQERNKIAYFRKILTDFADSIINDEKAMSTLGISLERYGRGNVVNEWSGTPCYPDLDLPEHPYYIGTHSYAMSPDFYMWSAYEDGTLKVKDQLMDLAKKGIKEVVNNSYDFQKKMQKDGIKAVADGGLNANNNSVIPKVGDIVFHPEGSDETDLLTKDATVKYHRNGSSIVSMSIEGVNGKEVWQSMPGYIDPISPTQEELVKDSIGIKNLITNGELVEWETFNGSTVNKDSYNVLFTKPPKALRLSNYDGGIQNLSSGSNQDEYAALDEKLKKVSNIREMFGSRQGYLGETITEENAPELSKTVSDTLLASLGETGNFFDPKNLETLALQSSASILSEKLTMRRAYPTFKLYFLEEDENETRWVNYDDFYSYNAIKEFTYFASRKEASRTATIVLQNINGTLDGTRRGAVVDLDYFDKIKTDRIQAKDKDANVLADSKNISAKDQPFNSLVLRPGLNVQLRVGYSNDPNMLHVLLNGRIVDLQWSKNNDIAEIVVQSFGTELTKSIKGIGGSEYDVDWASQVYYTTHELLSSLTLDRDLEHFGRWEFGAMRQIGEDKSADLDFYPYEREGYRSVHPVTSYATNFMTEHPVLTTVGLLAMAGGAAYIAKKGGILRNSKWAMAVANNGFVQSTLNIIRRTPILNRFVSKVYNKSLADDLFEAFGGGNHVINTSPLAIIDDIAIQTPALIKLRSYLSGLSQAEKARQIANLTSLLDDPIRFGDEIVELSRWAQANRHLYLPRFPIDTTLSWANLRNNAALAGKLTLGNIFIKVPRAGALASPILAGTTLAGDKVFTGTEEFVYKNVVQSWNNMGKVIKGTLKLTPSDDNIYCPSPVNYMTLGHLKGTGFIDNFSRVTNSFLKDFTGLDPYGWYGTLMTYLGKDPPANFLEKRVHPSACQYQIQASTVWDVFQEMTLRHPGWIVGTRPYGTEFRETIFFGTPSQRYWSRPGTVGFIARMNKLYNYIKNTSSSPKVLREQITQVYGSDIANKMFEEETSQNNIPLIQEKFRSSIVDEWLKGMEQRFEPYRKYHLITSEEDIVHNGIIASEGSVVNAVQVAYTEIDKVGEPKSENGVPVRKILQMKAHSLIPDNMLNTSVVDFPNCTSYKMALRYGQSALMYGLKEMYKGEILIIGNAAINPQDIAILVDNYNDISGPVEIESVVHMFSHETGFLTEIKPNAVVIGNEIATWPMLEAAKLLSMATQDIKDNGKPGENDALIREQLEGYNASTREYLKNRYLSIAQDSEIDEINKVLEKSQLKKAGIELEPISEAGTKVGAAGVVSLFGAAAAAFSGKQIFSTASSGGEVVKALINKTPMTSLFKGGLTKAGLGIVGAGIAGGVLMANSKNIGHSVASLLGTQMIFTKCMEQETVFVVPLLKGKRPIVGGLTLKNPSDIFNSILGSVSSAGEDIITGTKDIFDTYKQYRKSSWMYVGEIASNRKSALHKIRTEAEIFYNWREDSGL